MELLKSATKVVLLLMVLGLIVFVFIGKVEGKDFVMLASMVLAFYFGKKNLPNNPV